LHGAYQRIRLSCGQGLWQARAACRRL